ncbi:hypothetical protein [Candidatus Venteria ishoeyi]|uniref:Uncharacterized protein n=1 Tax=Candidatus Venteria ishoeyi TaxID=1899563 RepID=A0A1H6F343_9GAMM|nr:hypothetical protein [Candidatus Venteria ishoeyi]SEH04577.1 Uncharacterised protein [Candidatus Venteria ishoeyi]
MLNFKTLLQLGLLLLAAGLGAGKAWLDEQLQLAARNMVAQFAADARIQYQNLYMSLPMNAVMQGVHIQATQGQDFFIKRITLYQLHQLGHTQSIPDKLHLYFEGVQLAGKDLFPPLLKTALKASGYGAYLPDKLPSAKTLHLNIEIQTQIEAKTGTAQAQIQVDSPQLGVMQATLQWQGINFQQFSIVDVRWQHATVDYQAGSLFADIFKQLALQQQQTVPTIQTQLIQQVAKGIRGSLDKPSQQALLQWLKNPTKISLEIQPEPAISINQLLYTMPHQWAKQLGLSIRSKAAADK